MDISSNQGNVDHGNNTSRDSEDVDSQKERIPFGTEYFDAEARESFGRNVRLFMSLTDGSAIPPSSDGPDKAMPEGWPQAANLVYYQGVVQSR